MKDLRSILYSDEQFSLFSSRMSSDDFFPGTLNRFSIKYSLVARAKVLFISVLDIFRLLSISNSLPRTSRTFDLSFLFCAINLLFPMLASICS